MTTFASSTSNTETPEISGGSFGRNADELTVVRVGDTAFAMVPAHGGFHFSADRKGKVQPILRSDLLDLSENALGSPGLRRTGSTALHCVLDVRSMDAWQERKLISGSIMLHTSKLL